MATKKEFDLESMYRKIMPSSFEEEKPAVQEVNPVAPTLETAQAPSPPPSNASLLQEKEIIWNENPDGTPILYNVTEGIVLEKLEIAMQKMSCCKCDRCKKDVLALALNELPPHYVVSVKSRIEDKIKQTDKGQLVTTAILKAILAVRKNPRH